MPERDNRAHPVDEKLDAFRDVVDMKFMPLFDKAKEFTVDRVKAYGTCLISIHVPIAGIMFPAAIPYVAGAAALYSAGDFYLNGTHSLPYRVGQQVAKSWKTLAKDVFTVATLPLKPVIWGAKKLLATKQVTATEASPSPAQSFPEAVPGQTQTLSKSLSSAFAQLRQKPVANTNAPSASGPQQNTPSPGIKK